MKYCTKCGTRVEDNVTVCPNCGAVLPAGKGKQNVEKENVKVKVRILPIILALIGSLAVTAGSIFGSMQISPGMRASKELIGGDVTKAQEIYQNGVAGNSSQTKIFAKAVNDYMNDLEAAYQAGEIDNSELIAKLDVFLKFDVEGITDKATKYTADIQQILDAETLIAAKDYKGAIVQLRKIGEDSIKYDEAAKMLSGIISEYESEVIAEVGEPATLEDSERAIGTLKEAVELVPDNEVFTKKLSEISDAYVRQVLSLVGEPADNEGYANSITLLKSALEIDPSNVELTSKMDDLSAKYVNSVTALVDQKLDAFDYPGAEEAIAEAKKLLPDNQEIKEKADSLKDYKPFAMDGLKALDYKYFYIGDDQAFSRLPLDTFGNEYNGTNTAVMGSWGKFNAYATYNGGYRRLKGHVAVEDECDSGATLKLSVKDENGKVLKEWSGINRITDPWDIDVDVSGTTKVTISLDGEGSYDGYIILSDVFFYK